MRGTATTARASNPLRRRKTGCRGEAQRGCCSTLLVNNSLLTLFFLLYKNDAQKRGEKKFYNGTLTYYRKKNLFFL